MDKEKETGLSSQAKGSLVVPSNLKVLTCDNSTLGEKGKQWLQICRRHKDGPHMEKVFSVAFVPMTAQADKL